MAWYLAPALKRLRAEVDDAWPYRDRRSDGTVGDLGHQARRSDHNPRPPSGVVCAIDITASGVDTSLIISAAMRDPRTNYIIFNHRIYQRIHGFASRPYSGSNAHTQHVHISIRHGVAFENDTSPWLNKGQGGLPPGSGFEAGSPLDGMNLPGLGAIKIPPIVAQLKEHDMPVRIRRADGAIAIVDLTNPLFLGLDKTSNGVADLLKVELVADKISQFQFDQVRQFVKDVSTRGVRS